jgi:hypothetical protein
VRIYDLGEVTMTSRMLSQLCSRPACISKTSQATLGGQHIESSDGYISISLLGFQLAGVRLRGPEVMGAQPRMAVLR